MPGWQASKALPELLRESIVTRPSYATSRPPKTPPPLRSLCACALGRPARCGARRGAPVLRHHARGARWPPGRGRRIDKAATRRGACWLHRATGLARCRATCLARPRQPPFGSLTLTPAGRGFTRLCKCAWAHRPDPRRAQSGCEGARCAGTRRVAHQADAAPAVRGSGECACGTARPARGGRSSRACRQGRARVCAAGGAACAAAAAAAEERTAKGRYAFPSQWPVEARGHGGSGRRRCSRQRLHVLAGARHIQASCAGGCNARCRSRHRR